MTEPLPPEDRLDELPLLVRRAIARTVAATADMTPRETLWLTSLMAKLIAADDVRTIQNVPDSVRDVLLHFASMVSHLRPEVSMARGVR